MRQPSAEDLDAAHQLVSSARGGRNSLGTLEPRARTEDEYGPLVEGASTALDAVQSATSNQSALSGQVCRCDTCLLYTMFMYN
jgi:hypothetical protein